MQNTDGAVVISVKCDTKDAGKELERLQKKLKKAEDAYSDKTSRRDAAKAALDSKRQELAETERTMQRLRDETKSLESSLNPYTSTENLGPEEFIRRSEVLSQCKAQIAEMEELQKKQSKEAETLDKKYRDIEQSTKKAAENLAQVKKEAGAAVSKLRETSVVEKASVYAQKLGASIKNITKRALVFSVIAAAFRKLKDLMSAAVKQNDEASAAFGRLRGALLTLAQPVIEVILPVFTALANIIAKIINVAARLISALFGKSFSQMSKNAAGLYEQSEAIDSVGKSAKNANKYLAPFDELTVMSGADSADSAGGGGSITPSFDGMESASPLLDVLSGKLQTIGTIVGNIFTDVKGLFEKLLSGDLGGVLDQVVKIDGHIRELISEMVLFVGEAVGGIIDWVIEKFNLAGTPIGDALTAIKNMVMDEATFISALLMGDFEQLSESLSSFLANAQNLLFSLIDGAKGIIDKFMTWLDKKTGGKFHGIIEFIKTEFSWLFSFVRDLAGAAFATLKEILGGIIDFIAGVFTGDWERAWNGIKRVFTGIATAIAGVFASVLNVIIRAINWITAQINKIDISVPDWVPFIGGKGFNPNIKPLKEFQIPRLAQGAVIPANREFLAVLGDQKRGTNIEAPADLIRQIVREEVGQASGSTHVTIVLDSVDGKKLFDTIVRENNSVIRATGASPLKV
mgnify:FL=1